jgi:uncharacterized protein
VADFLARMRRCQTPPAAVAQTSAQRVHWFRQGFESGQIEQCDTFKAGSL